MWIALKLFGGKLFGIVGAVLKWLFEDIKRAIIAVALVTIFVLYTGNASLRDANRAIAQGLAVEKDAHLETIAAMAAAQIEAERLADENVNRVENEWRNRLEQANENRENIAADYRRRVAGFMRTTGTNSRSGGTGNAALPDNAAVPGQPVPDAAFAVVPRTDLERCADAFATLAAVIAAWNELAAVPTSP